jgi:hypothetical protein
MKLVKYSRERPKPSGGIGAAPQLQIVIASGPGTLIRGRHSSEDMGWKSDAWAKAVAAIGKRYGNKQAVSRGFIAKTMSRLALKCG